MHAARWLPSGSRRPRQVQVRGATGSGSRKRRSLTARNCGEDTTTSGEVGNKVRARAASGPACSSSRRPRARHRAGRRRRARAPPSCPRCIPLRCNRPSEHLQPTFGLAKLLSLSWMTPSSSRPPSALQQCPTHAYTAQRRKKRAVECGRRGTTGHRSPPGARSRHGLDWRWSLPPPQQGILALDAPLKSKAFVQHEL